MRIRPLLGLATVIALGTACQPAEMTGAEVLEALAEVGASARGEQATTEPIELSTDFTIGAALDAAADELAAFWESQEPCTDVTWSGTEVTVDYGGLDDTCTYNGNTFGGIAFIDIGSTEASGLQVDHTWTGITNGDVTVDGGATVTWTDANTFREVTTDHTWTDVKDGTVVDVQGQHTLTWIDDTNKALGGVVLDGDRSWQSESGDWHLDMNDLELRLQDPVAQAGTLSVLSPNGKSLDMVHERIDEDTIRVTLEGTRRTWVYDINRLGVPTEVTE